MTKSRPLGITVMAILVGLVGVLTILGGLSLLGLGLVGVVYDMPWLGAYSGLMGIFTLLWGIFGFYVARGLWGLEKWAWTWSMIWLTLDAVISFLSGGLMTVIVALVIIIYLYTKKSLFR